MKSIIERRTLHNCFLIFFMIYCVFILSNAIEVNAQRVLRKRGGGGHGGGGGNGGGGGGGTSNLSQFPPGAFCNANESCTSPAMYVKSLPLPSRIDGTNGGSATIRSEKACQQIFFNSNGSPCGSQTEIWAYDGQFPGPTVVTQKGIPFDIEHINDLGKDYEGKDIPITTHHHGLKILPAFDGHPQADKVSDPSFAIDQNGLIYPGSSYTYETTNEQEPGTHWYHDHKLHESGRHVIMGLAAFFLILPDNESIYNNVRGGDKLPNGEYEIELAFQDRSFTANTNQFNYPMNLDELKSSGLVNAGYFGNRMLVNGMYAPYLNVKRGWYRFRFLNGCDARQLEIRLTNANGSTISNRMFQLGTEGGHIQQRRGRSRIYMAPGERYDILIDFSSLSVGTRLYLRNTYNQSPIITNMMQFRVISGSTPNFSIPTSLVPYIFPSNPSVTRTISLVSPRGNTGAWTIGGIRYDPNVANLQVRKGSTERWTFTARMSRHPHPMHLHLVQFHISGVSTGSLEDGWKDIVMIPPNGSRSIDVTFNGEPGIYMFHCHNLEHEDYDMMLQYEVCDDTPQHPCFSNLLNAFVGGRGGHSR